MDVTPQLIEQIDFSEKFRGYDPDQVDDFLERVGATIAELHNANRDANERIARLEADLRAGGGGESTSRPPVLSDEEEAMQSTRTLMMAKRTADAAIADARQEAQKMVGEARTTADQLQREAQTEADRIVGEARVNADQMMQKAAAEASREYGVRRDQILAEIGELEGRKVTITGQLDVVERRLEEYRGALGRVHDSLGKILDDPDAMLREPIEGLDLPPLRSVAPEPEPEPVVEPEPEPVVEPEPVASAPAFDDQPVVENVPFDAPAPDESEEPVAFAAPFGDDDDLDLPFRPANDSATELLASADLAWNDGDAGNGSSPAADPWGPGSWGEVASSSDSPFGFDDAPSGVGSGDRAFTDSFDDAFDASMTGSHDRYSRDLEQAVNSPDDADEAMAAFFEGDDDPGTRRFGRRR